MSSMEKWLSLGRGGPNDPLDPEFQVISGEPSHMALSGLVTTVAKRNPYVFVAMGLGHAGYHFLSKHSGSSSQTYQQNGGPETKSTYKPSGHTPTLGARSVNSAHGGRRSGSKPRKKCPPGFRWSARLQTCIFSSKKKGYSKVWDKR